MVMDMLAKKDKEKAIEFLKEGKIKDLPIARLKNFQSMASFPLATTNPYLLEHLNFVIHTGKEGLFNEKNVRMFSKKYKGSLFVEYTNDFLLKLFGNTIFRNMHNFSYDCSEIPVNLKNDKFEHSSVITEKKVKRSEDIN